MIRKKTRYLATFAVPAKEDEDALACPVMLEELSDAESEAIWGGTTIGYGYTELNAEGSPEPKPFIFFKGSTSSKS
ncbi:hypothetical protein DSM106972_008490 [Dulcicalothrix desertica PCC 7102]|uniref:Uncharacterized protein n=1 Tax=Dulcicalothrix desertica PCC 7102 TaxID=232991 RepID=A0A433VRS2_9CYAN|nr:hypothetical protein [Dulcicalothrix desertica]RUT08796.1 hypothetical protein DSM106972_008490 [Dulcicalothrix desertica PCC 7102]TWH44187.1 hypothetical protein CAL7102_07971 [Dulcicalothrix desertica PCC 7102]